MDVEGDAFRRRLLIASRILAEQQLQLQRQAARRQTLVALIRNQIAQQLAFCLYLAVFRKPNRALARREPRIRVRAAGLQRLPLYRRPVRLYWNDYRYDTASCLDSTRFTPEELDELAQLIAEPHSQVESLSGRQPACTCVRGNLTVSSKSGGASEDSGQSDLSECDLHVSNRLDEIGSGQKC